MIIMNDSDIKQLNQIQKPFFFIFIKKIKYNNYERYCKFYC